MLKGRGKAKIAKKRVIIFQNLMQNVNPLIQGAQLTSSIINLRMSQMYMDCLVLTTQKIWKAERMCLSCTGECT